MVKRHRKKSVHYKTTPISEEHDQDLAVEQNSRKPPSRKPTSVKDLVKAVITEGEESEVVG